jgi:hypothetical protein
MADLRAGHIRGRVILKPDVSSAARRNRMT